MKYLFIGGSQDGNRKELSGEPTSVSFYNSVSPIPTWYTKAEAPEDVMLENTDKYIRIYICSYYNKAYHVYLYYKSSLQLDDILKHILINYTPDTGVK